MRKLIAIAIVTNLTAFLVKIALSRHYLIFPDFLTALVLCQLSLVFDFFKIIELFVFALMEK